MKNAVARSSEDIPAHPHAHAHARRAITAHFAGRAMPAAEAEMRTHLSACADCRRAYDRHLILARLDPLALPAEQRLAAGLGFRTRTRPNWDGWSRWAMGLAIPAAAAAILFTVLPGRLLPGSLPPGKNHPDSLAKGDQAIPDFAARGARALTANKPSFWTYRIATNGAPRLADRTIAPEDELAFAYSNPVGKPYLMIFGVDEHRHIYWFHPAWPTGQPAPVAIRATAGPGPHELRDAIRHAIDGRRLDVYAIFSERAIATTTVEQQIRAATAADSVTTLGDGDGDPGSTIVDRRTFQVMP